MDAPQRQPLATVAHLNPNGSSVPMPRPTRATYTVREVAALLDISRATAYTRLASGEIPARRIGSRWIIARRRFDAWLNGEPAEVRPTGTEVSR
jgi:excisionase family DNA binding protein